MSQRLSQLASLQPRPDLAVDDLARKEAIPVAHHQMEEATYGSGALALEEAVVWVASVDPAHDMIHIDLRSPFAQEPGVGPVTRPGNLRRARAQEDK